MWPSFDFWMVSHTTRLGCLWNNGDSLQCSFGRRKLTLLLRNFDKKRLNLSSRHWPENVPNGAKHNPPVTWYQLLPRRAHWPGQTAPPRIRFSPSYTVPIPIFQMHDNCPAVSLCDLRARCSSTRPPVQLRITVPGS